MRKQNKDKLYSFLVISNLAFDIVMCMGAMNNGKYIVTPIHNYYRKALKEIERKNPNMGKVMQYMKHIEILTKRVLTNQ